jgi:hypothetical protein
LRRRGVVRIQRRQAHGEAACVRHAELGFAREWSRVFDAGSGLHAHAALVDDLDGLPPPLAREDARGRVTQRNGQARAEVEVDTRDVGAGGRAGRHFDRRRAAGGVQDEVELVGVTVHAPCGAAGQAIGGCVL